MATARSRFRVIAGDHGGRGLLVPDCARPATERVREAVFSALGDRFVDVTVLDLFAGSGALAIEALSRGAARAVLVDRESASMTAIRKNLITLELLTRARAVRRPVKTFLGANPPREAPFGLVLCDPPFDLPGPELERALGLLEAPGWLAPGASVVVTRPSTEGSVALPDAWMSTWRRAYGDTLVAIATVPEHTLKQP